jgi:methyl coenzyme M reductase gamma subunit
MTFDDLIREWRFADHAAKAIGVSRATLYVWRYRGIPAHRQAAIRKIIAARQKAAKRAAA